MNISFDVVLPLIVSTVTITIYLYSNFNKIFNLLEKHDKKLINLKLDMYKLLIEDMIRLKHVPSEVDAVFDKYQKLGGNSYVKDDVEKYRKEFKNDR